MNNSDLWYSQHIAIPANSEEIEKDDIGFTNENLHRRIDNNIKPIMNYEVKPKQYTISLLGLDSYRETDIITHDEDSDISEIP